MASTENELLLSSEEFENILLNHDDMKGYLKKLTESCRNFHSDFERRIADSISKNSQHAKEFEKSHETLSQLSNEKKELKNAIENIKLERKVVEKKTLNIIKEIEKTKDEMESCREKREKISLEIVDVQQDYEKQKEHMKKDWNALKRACSVYKNILDIHIATEMTDHLEQVTVTFFWVENPTDKKFFVLLTNQDNCWKVKKIEPELSMEQKYQLNHVVQFSKQSEVANVSMLICKLRELFLKNYFEKGAE